MIGRSGAKLSSVGQMRCPRKGSGQFPCAYGSEVRDLSPGAHDIREVLKAREAREHAVVQRGRLAARTGSSLVRSTRLTTVCPRAGVARIVSARMPIAAPSASSAGTGDGAGLFGWLGIPAHAGITESDCHRKVNRVPLRCAHARSTADHRGHPHDRGIVVVHLQIVVQLLNRP